MTPERVPAGWRAATYGTALIEQDERAGARVDLPVLSVTKTRGPMLASERFGKVLHSRDLSRYRVAHRNVIVADPMLLWDGSIGIQRVVDAGLVSPDYRVYALSDDADPDFLAYVVRSPTMLPHYQGGARGTNVRRNRIARADFLAIPLALPPLPEQRKIAAILSSVDDAIETTQAIIDQLQVVKKAMMAELLTRGLPGRHTRFKQTEIGEVPEGWDTGRLRDFAVLTSGGTPSRDRADFWNGDIAWVKTGEINYRTISQTEETISTLGLKNSAAKVLPPGTLLMAMYGQGATRGRVATLGISATVNQACLAILPAPGLSTRFLFHVFSHKYEELRSLGHEGTQKNLNAKLVGDVLIPRPPSDEQHEIVSILDDVQARIDAEAVLGTHLATVKSALTSVLLTGELRVTPDEASR